MTAKPTYEKLEQRVKELENESVKLKLLVQTLHENVLKVDDIIEKAAFGICVCHNISEKPYVRFTLWNPWMSAITGYTMAEINKLGWYQTMYPDPQVQKQAVERMTGMREGNDIVTEEWVITTSNGDKKPLSISTSIVKEEDGKAHVIAIMQDITKHKRAEKDLELKNAELNSFIDNMPDMAWVTDADSRFILVNRAFGKAVGMAPKSLINHTYEICFGEDKAKRFKADDQNLIKEKKQMIIEEKIIDSKKNEVWLETIKSPILDESGKVVGTVGISRDISRHKRTEEELVFKTTLLEAQSEASIDGMLVVDSEAKVVSFNERMKEMWNVPRELWDTRDDETLLRYAVTQLENPDEFLEKVRYLYAHKEEISRDEIKLINGKWFDRYSSPLIDSSGKNHGRIWYFRDITDRRRAEDQIQASLKEKEVLLREIHHRIKNNMQVIISLLRLQSANIEDKKYADMFKESQDRIKSMSFIHEKLYQSKDLTNLDFKEYVKALVNGLLVSHLIDTDRIIINMEIENIFFELNTAIPCGLIINELVSNSLKHAFPQDTGGNISLRLRSIGEDEFELIFSDDGIGISEDLDIQTTDTLGLSIVRILTQYQLDGKIELNRTKGAQFNIKFNRIE